MPYCTSTDVKLWGGWADSDAGDDPVIAVLIPYAQQMIDSYCNRSFEMVTTSDQSDSDVSTARIFDAAADFSVRNNMYPVF